MPVRSRDCSGQSRPSARYWSSTDAVRRSCVCRMLPPLPYRGYYHDVTRGRVPTLHFLKQLADKLSEYKLNQMQLYIENTYLFRDFSEVWRSDDPLTPEEIIELDDYCYERGIELVPSISTFSHLYQVLRTRQFSYLCELENSCDDPFDALGQAGPPHHRHHQSRQLSLCLPDD